MKTVMSLALLSTMVWSSSTLAFNSFACKAQVSDTTKNLTAPYLVGQSKNSLTKAVYKEEVLSVEYNTYTVKNGLASLVFDGRAKRVQLNVHIAATESLEGVQLEMRDTVSGKTLSREVTHYNSGKTISLVTANGRFDYTCSIN